MLFKILVGALCGTIIGSIRDMKKELRVELERLRGEVAESSTVMAGAAALIVGLAAQLRENAGDPDAIAAMADSLDAEQAKLAVAIADNTGAEAEVETAPEEALEPIAEEPAAETGTDTATGEETGTTTA